VVLACVKFCAMSTHIASNTSSINALLSGIGSAFSFAPSGVLERYLRLEPVEKRLYNNFAQVGKHLENASRKVAGEQAAARKTTR